MRWPRGVDGLCHGGDYNPEQWPAQVWAQDVVLMRQARVNLVTVGVFAWSRLEPHPGRYDFDWLDRVLDLLYDNGIRVALATPTASPPPWFSLAHPEALPVTADGVRLHHGSRDTYCVAAPAYRRAARGIAEALADRYRNHPGLALWHVHNEYGTTCHCGYATDAFRDWLRTRHGDLDRLNDAWSTSFWSQHYSDWAQVATPRATQYLANPAQLLDFRRFWSDELLSAYVEQRDLLRAATPDVPVTTNYVLGDWVPVDHARWSSEVDLVTIDHYPSAADRGAEEQIAFAADLARSWARRVPGDVHGLATGEGGPVAGRKVPDGTGWLLMESAPNLIYVPGRMHSREPGRLLRNSLAYVARGSRGAMFFQWRAPAGGAERFHSALVPHAGPDSRVFRETVELGRILSELSEAVPPAATASTGSDVRAPAPVGSAAARTGEAEASAAVWSGEAEASAAVWTGEVEASVAIAWDAECGWALAGPGLPSSRLDYRDEVAAAHRSLWRAGFTADFVGPDQLTRTDGPDPLAGYKLLVLPALYLVSDLVAARVRDWVAGGGHLLVGYLSGVADEHGRIRLGGYPGAFRDLLGIRVEEFHPLADNERFPLVPLADAEDDQGHSTSRGRPSALSKPGEPSGRLWSETVRLNGARTVLAYADGRLAGQPAVTRNRFGGGVAWYVSTRLDDAGYRSLLERAARAAGAGPVCSSLPAGVEAVSRRTPGGTRWLYLFNHDDEERSVAVAGIPVLATGVDGTRPGGAPVGPPVVVPAGGCLVLRRPAN
ncbi:beta-galactosidase [Micromonospora sp. NPDC050397]|uniref:beta-galactosidase n=1 Tax=Micromonospora sp. NPDC050397 TaxID=3364279 RepID=UPI0038503EE2